MRVPTQEVGVPTYQYACTESACGHRFEAVQSFSDNALDVCPVCEGNVRKVFSAVGVVFKGSGFYRTDNRQPERTGAKAGSESSGGKDGANGKSESSAASSSSSSSSSGSGSTGSSSSAGSGSSGSSQGSTSKAAAS